MAEITVSQGRDPRPGPGLVGPYRSPRHLYYFGDKGPWPGVTGITGILDKPALTKWHREQVARAAIRDLELLKIDRDRGDEEAAVTRLLAVRDESSVGRERGTAIHNALEAVLRREPWEIAPEYRAAVDGARAWLNERKPRVIEVEAFLIHESLGYGGTCDLIAEIDGEVWLLDWKSSKSVADAKGRVWDEMRLQLAAYANAEFIARPGDSERYPLPSITRHGILHVTDAGTRLFDANVAGADWSAFKACLSLYHWRKGKAA